MFYFQPKIVKFFWKCFSHCNIYNIYVLVDVTGWWFSGAVFWTAYEQFPYVTVWAQISIRMLRIQTLIRKKASLPNKNCLYGPRSLSKCQRDKSHVFLRITCVVRDDFNDSVIIYLRLMRTLLRSYERKNARRTSSLQMSPQ